MHQGLSPSRLSSHMMCLSLFSTHATMCVTTAATTSTACARWTAPHSTSASSWHPCRSSLKTSAMRHAQLWSTTVACEQASSSKRCSCYSHCSGSRLQEAAELQSECLGFFGWTVSNRAECCRACVHAWLQGGCSGWRWYPYTCQPSMHVGGWWAFGMY